MTAICGSLQRFTKFHEVFIKVYEFTTESAADQGEENLNQKEILKILPNLSSVWV
jgi:hypothetical protein